MNDISIGSAAVILGIPVHQVRRLSDRGVLRVHLTESGHRRFRREELISDYRVVHPEWEPATLFTQTYPLEGLEEDQVWRSASMDAGLSGNAKAVAGYAVTEMVNNAIDHSSGTSVSVTVSDDIRLVVTIQDDGIGVFENLRSRLGLADLFASIQELSKGKRTTDESRHTGEGIFFTSKAVEFFVLESNGLRMIVDNLADDVAVRVDGIATGTRVTLHLDRNRTAPLRAVFDPFTNEAGAFSKTRPVVKLFELGTDLISRSEAKRLTSGLEKFEEVELDFNGVDTVGQGFVDEVFRVWARSNPGTSLVPTRMNEAVDFMINRGLRR